MGVKAVESLLEGKGDLMTGLQGRGIEMVPLEEVIANKQQANEDYYRMARVSCRECVSCHPERSSCILAINHQSEGFSTTINQLPGQ
jgi:6-phosphofructokinase